MGTEDEMTWTRWARMSIRRYYRHAMVYTAFKILVILLIYDITHTGVSTKPEHEHTRYKKPTHNIQRVVKGPIPILLQPLSVQKTLPSMRPTIFEPTDREEIHSNRTEEIARRRTAVLAELRHSYKGYEIYAFGHDELKPISRSYKDWSHDKGGLSVTMIDSLSTLWICGMHEEFTRAVEHIRAKLTFDIDTDVSHFESTIRLVGGLLSAYELSDMKYDVLLARARELMDRLLPAYETASHIPHSVVNLRHGNSTGLPWQGYASPLAEYGTVHLELRALTYHTGDLRYGQAAEAINRFLTENCRDLCPTMLHPDEGRFKDDLVTLGGLGDSYYEYLLKQWIYTGKEDTPTLYRYLRAAESIINKLTVNQSGFVYVAQQKGEFLMHRMDHLACFVPGMFVLADRNVDWSDGQGPLEHPSGMRRQGMLAAEGLLETCWQLYNQTGTKLGAEVVVFNDENVDDGDPNFMRVWRHHQPYLLRPEVIESMYYMWVHTRNPKWQDRAWQIFRAIRHYCRVPHGYSGIVDVMGLPPEHDDLMQSFWIAETLKYLFLIHSEDPATQEKFLAEWVLNTEAHPLKIRNDYYTKFPMQI